MRDREKKLITKWKRERERRGRREGGRRGDDSSRLSPRRAGTDLTSGPRRWYEFIYTAHLVLGRPQNNNVKIFLLK